MFIQKKISSITVCSSDVVCVLMEINVHLRVNYVVIHFVCTENIDHLQLLSMSVIGVLQCVLKKH